jgi:hypothetical protein
MTLASYISIQPDHATTKMPFYLEIMYIIPRWTPAEVYRISPRERSTAPYPAAPETNRKRTLCTMREPLDLETNGTDRGGALA